VRKLLVGFTAQIDPVAATFVVKGVEISAYTCEEFRLK
jgi:hypothetical protein